MFRRRVFDDLEDIKEIFSTSLKPVGFPTCQARLGQLAGCAPPDPTRWCFVRVLDSTGQVTFSQNCVKKMHKLCVCVCFMWVALSPLSVVSRACRMS